MYEEWVGCCVCGKPFKRDTIKQITLSNPPTRVAVCSSCIRRRDLQEKIFELIQANNGDEKNDARTTS